MTEWLTQNVNMSYRAVTVIFGVWYVEQGDRARMRGVSNLLVYSVGEYAFDFFTVVAGVRTPEFMYHKTNAYRTFHRDQSHSRERPIDFPFCVLFVTSLPLINVSASIRLSVGVRSDIWYILLSQ